MSEEKTAETKRSAKSELENLRPRYINGLCGEFVPKPCADRPAPRLESVFGI